MSVNLISQLDSLLKHVVTNRHCKHELMDGAEGRTIEGFETLYQENYQDHRKLIKQNILSFGRSSFKNNHLFHY